MFKDEVLIEAARAVRPYLRDLIGPRAADLDALLSSLLQRYISGENVSSEILRLLQKDEATREWLAELLEDPSHLPPEFQAVRSGTFEPPPGRGNPKNPPKWICPVDGNYIAYRRSWSDPIPECLEHHVELVRAV